MQKSVGTVLTALSGYGEICVPVDTSHVRALTLEVLGIVCILKDAECVHPEVGDVEGTSDGYGVLDCSGKQLEGDFLLVGGEVRRGGGEGLACAPAVT